MTSTDLFRGLGQVVRRAPAALDLIEIFADRAQPADLTRTGAAVLNLVNPGSGRHVAPAVTSIRRALELLVYQTALDSGAEESETWADFLVHLGALRWKVIVFFGDPGSGKTSMALKLADMWRRRTGYPVEMVGEYDDEGGPEWATHISMRRFIKRMQKVRDYIDQEETDKVVDDGISEEELRPRKGKAPPQIGRAEFQKLKHRIVIVDEAAAFFSAISRDQQQAREASRNLNNQVRHLESIYVFVCQAISEMPRYLQRHAIQFYKFASEETLRLDWREGFKRETRERWTEVLLGLNAIQTGSYPEPMSPMVHDEAAAEAIRAAARAHTFYEGDLGDRRSWAWVVAPNIGGHRYRGVVPFTPLGADEPEADADDGNVIDLSPDEYEIIRA